MEKCRNIGKNNNSLFFFHPFTRTSARNGKTRLCARTRVRRGKLGTSPKNPSDGARGNSRAFLESLFWESGVASADPAPAFAELFLVVFTGLQPVRHPSRFFPSVSQFANLGRQQDERRRLRNDFVHDYPEVSHDLVERIPERHRRSFTERLDLDGNEASCRMVVCHDVDPSGVPGRRHDVPSEKRQVIAAVIQSGVSNDLCVELHDPGSR